MRAEIVALHARLEQSEAGANVRADMALMALQKISQDVSGLVREKDTAQAAASVGGSSRQTPGQVRTDGDDQTIVKSKTGGAETLPGGVSGGIGGAGTDVGVPGVGPGGASGAVAAAMRRKKVSKKALEACFQKYQEEMISSSDLDDVKEKGKLCVKYAKDMFNNYF